MIDWLDELRIAPGPPYGTMGLHALALDQWLVVDENRSQQLARKAELLRDSRGEVFAALPGSEKASAELLAQVSDWLHARQMEFDPPVGEDHPLADAARVVQEDLAVMEERDGRWTLTAGAVCFPTHWSVADKVGLPLDGIHAPVADYETELRRKVDQFFDRLAPARPVWRRNWFVLPTDELHLPAYDQQMQVPRLIEPDGSPMWIRSERQTLRRLPRSGAIVFTIRIQQAPLGVLLERRDLAAQMLVAVRSWDHEKRLYTSTGGVLDTLIDWLSVVDDGRAGRVTPLP